jgi:S-adenosyl-L-methionine hydrolase (adenosine-forming)
MIVTLLTDFGIQDTFSGILKGVIKTIAPHAELIDLTHQVPAQDIAAGAFALSTAYRYFPPGTIHLVVVDPGVGSDRHPVAAHIGDMIYVCPDNGLLTYVLPKNRLHEAVILDNTQYHLPDVSNTFHGRDIFAPVAAHLANGVPLRSLGTPIYQLLRLPVTYPEVQKNIITGHIIAFDVYGNAYTDITKDLLSTWSAQDLQISIGDLKISSLAMSYSDVPIGSPLALFGSSGHLEIAIRNGNAGAQLGLQHGAVVWIADRKENGFPV